MKRASSEKCIVLFGLFGVGNLGNDASLEAMLHHIRLRQPGVAITCVCGDPSKVAATYGIQTMPFDMMQEPYQQNRILRSARWLIKRSTAEVDFWLNTTRWLRTVQHLIIVGTGILDDFGERPWRLPYDLFKWCWAARLVGTKLVFLSVGAGPIENRFSRLLMLSALRQADYRSYRDVVSAEYLNSVGFQVQADPVFPDLVYSLPESMWVSCPPPSVPPRTIGLGVMGYYGWRNDRSRGETIYQKYLAKLKHFAGWVLENGYALRLLTGEIRTDQRPVDELLSFICSGLPGKQQARVTAEQINSTGELLREIAATDLVVATRFHNVLCALMLGRPVISLGYNKKNEALMAEMGLQQYCQHIESFDVEQLILHFKSLVSLCGQATVSIRDKGSEYRQKLDEQYDHILGARAVNVSALPV
jgi:polysaccharide pyruvyl transferase WcaK-like protein